MHMIRQAWCPDLATTAWVIIFALCVLQKGLSKNALSCRMCLANMVRADFVKHAVSVEARFMFGSCMEELPVVIQLIRAHELLIVVVNGIVTLLSKCRFEEE